jgi:hypothetical protein
MSDAFREDFSMNFSRDGTLYRLARLAHSGAGRQGHGGILSSPAERLR